MQASSDWRWFTRPPPFRRWSSFACQPLLAGRGTLRLRRSQELGRVGFIERSPGPHCGPRSGKLQGQMNPLAPQTDKVFDREVKCVRRGSGCKQGCTVSAHYSVGSRLHPSLEKVKSNGRATALVSRVGRTTASHSLQSSSPSSSHHYHHRNQTLVLIIITAIIITIPSPPSPTPAKR